MSSGRISKPHRPQMGYYEIALVPFRGPARSVSRVARALLLLGHVMLPVSKSTPHPISFVLLPAYSASYVHVLDLMLMQPSTSDRGGGCCHMPRDADSGHGGSGRCAFPFSLAVPFLGCADLPIYRLAE